MKLSIVGIDHQGDREHEVVTLKVSEDCDLRSYLLTDADYDKDEQRMSNPFRHTFWFEATPAKRGDYVMVHTRAGTASHHPNQLGTTSHEFFWDRPEAVWHEKDDAALLFEIAGHSLDTTRSFVSYV
jgi:hypothetical protein